LALRGEQSVAEENQIRTKGGDVERGQLDISGEVFWL